MANLREGTVHEVTLESRTLVIGGADVPVFHARPDGLPAAGLVVHPDIMGLRPLFDDLARRLASHGLAVCVVEPFARVPGYEKATLDDRLAAVRDLDDDVQLGDLSAAADLLVIEDDVTQVSVMGFCMGGYYTLKAAATDRFDRAVAFYAMLRTPEMWRGPGHRDEPLDVAAGVCPTLAVFGTADVWSPPEDLDALRRAWDGRDDCEMVVVEGAEHGFVHDPERPAHRPEEAAELWERALAWVLP